MKNLLILLTLLVLLLYSIITFPYNFKETHNGAYVQLAAKGPQDTYLTDDAWKYLYYPYHYPYSYIYGSPYNIWPYPISTRRKTPLNTLYIGKYPYYHYVFN